LTVGPCFQTGVFSVTFTGAPIPSPTGFCNTQTDTATVTTPTATPADAVTVSTNDNRAFSDPNGATPNAFGGLVSLTVPVGEADSINSFVNPLPFIVPTGFPTCAADLEFQAVTCTGLVPSESYSVTDGSQTAHGTADSTGAVSVSLALHGGDVVGLSNGSRTLTSLHVAHLRVDIAGGQSVLAGGSCEPGDYFAPPLNLAPINGGAGEPTAVAGGSALTGEICPVNGNATGLPSGQIVQTDDASGGQTMTEVPHVLDTSPIEGENTYGTFTALAESGIPGPNNTTISTDGFTTIALSIAKSSGGKPVLSARNVDTPNGVKVTKLKPGAYTATWTLVNLNGDTRTVTTRFIEQSGPPAPGPKPVVKCVLLRSGKIKCTVTFPGHKPKPKHKKKKKGRGKTPDSTLRVSIKRGGQVIALGHGNVSSQGSATITLRELRHVSRGVYRVTLVLDQSGSAPVTLAVNVYLK
jgi:hypothetical protein